MTHVVIRDILWPWEPEGRVDYEADHIIALTMDIGISEREVSEIYASFRVCIKD